MRRLALIAALAALPLSALAPAAPALAMTPAAGLAGAAPLGDGADGAIVSVRDGCGLGGHRDYYGRCVPNVRPYGYGLPPRPVYVVPARPFYRACPPGFHFGPRLGRCFPNY